MKILVACEESQAVTIELRKLGHEAYSCDLYPCSGGYPQWHLQQDVLPLLKDKWDMIIAFPPCTYLSNAGMCNLTRKNASEEYREQRRQKTKEAVEFIKAIISADCDKIAIENPVGVLSTLYRKPDQIIQPFMFGHSVNKKTCLWLKGLPKLKPTKIVEKDTIVHWGNGKPISKWYRDTLTLCKGNLEELSKLRSKTFQGIAKAMAAQWTNYDETKQAGDACFLINGG
ncbi:MAG: hypothetical protein FWC80_00370 [Firmicutes bacterium]|nr:hypothetical protein [Bacillota bacterium]